MCKLGRQAVMAGQKNLGPYVLHAVLVQDPFIKCWLDVARWPITTYAVQASWLSFLIYI